MYDTIYSKKGLNKKALIIIPLIIIVVFLIIFFSSRSKSYAYYEKQMINSAKEYVKNNNMLLLNETYIEISKLKLDIKENCSQISGVIINNNTYTAYLSCEEYESKIVNNSDTITLKGREVILLPKGISYIEPGYISDKEVKINNTIGTEEGIYNVYYHVIENNQIVDVLTRKVIIVDDIFVASLYPNIDLDGEEIEYLTLGESYIEKGASAQDSIDGDISSKVVIEGEVNINVEGKYKRFYTVTNSQGYTRSIERTIVVTNDYSDIVVTDISSPLGLTNQDVIIAFNILGEKYSHTKLPDNTINYNRSYIYKISENGLYEFLFYDKDGKIVTKTYNISNINRELPQGTCRAILYNDRTEITTTATSTNQISGYQYILDNNETSYYKSFKYTSNIVEPKKISVKVKDSINNISEFTCTTEDKTVPRIYVNEYGKNCLEGYVCYIQGKFGSERYPFCSTETCGPISKRGCSITSMTTAISVYNKRSSNGELYTPYTLLTEVYNKVCSRSCSGFTTFQEVASYLGLSSTEVYRMNEANANILRDFLKKGPVLIHAKTGPYTSGMHLMALLAVDNNGLVYLYNTGYTTRTRDSDYKADSWVPISDLISGNVDYFMGIAPFGVYSN